jgi:mRNA interferase RelE/StbE
MVGYSILLRASVGKDLDAMPKNDLQRIMERTGSLAENPRPDGCGKLSVQGKYRVRQGNYRIIYSIQSSELTVWVVKVGHHREV